MSKERVDLSVEICKRLPFDLTILADEEYCCIRHKPDCLYCRVNLENLCYKKTINAFPLVKRST